MDNALGHGFCQLGTQEQAADKTQKQYTHAISTFCFSLQHICAETHKSLSTQNDIQALS